VIRPLLGQSPTLTTRQRTLIFCAFAVPVAARVCVPFLCAVVLPGAGLPVPLSMAPPIDCACGSGQLLPLRLPALQAHTCFPERALAVACALLPGCGVVAVGGAGCGGVWWPGVGDVSSPPPWSPRCRQVGANDTLDARAVIAFVRALGWGHVVVLSSDADQYLIAAGALVVLGSV
jgi:hypothetical protein